MSATNAGPTEFPRDSQPGPKGDKNVQIPKESTHKNHSLVPMFWERRSEEGTREMVAGSVQAYLQSYSRMQPAELNKAAQTFHSIRGFYY